MEAESNKANDDLQYYRRFTSPMHNGFTRKQMIRQLTNRKRMLDARIRRLIEQKNAQ
ncbi:hypothetical protein [Leuconostoc sp. S51]|nr:hypothetical protein [Leuconostoc sp. S51]